MRLSARRYRFKDGRNQDGEADPSNLGGAEGHDPD